MTKNRVFSKIVAAVFVCAIWATALAEYQLTTEERARRETIKRERGELAGLTAENCYLQAKRIQGETVKFGPVPCPKEMFPYDWSFDDNTLCGISQVGGGLKDFGVKNGALAFTTGKDANYFSWGDFDKTKAPLNFAFNDEAQDNDGRKLRYVQFRMRQSKPKSAWQVEVKRVVWNGGVFTSPVVTVKGEDWQTVTMGYWNFGHAPYTALRLLTDTPDNRVEIDWVRPRVCGPPVYYRKTLTLPDKVKWAKASISAGPYFHFYVNGELAAQSPLPSNCAELWEYALDPKLFKAGDNVLAFTCDVETRGEIYYGAFLLDGALVCENGAYYRFDSDTSWKFKQDVPSRDWMTSAYDDRDWGKTKLFQNSAKQSMESFMPSRNKFWFNPSWKGRIQVTPADREEPIYGKNDPIVLKVNVAAPKDANYRLEYQVVDEMGDNFVAYDTPVKSGVAKNDVLTFAPGELPFNKAYAAIFKLFDGEKEIEKYRYELAICGPVAQKVVDDPADYATAMKRTLVWELDPAGEPVKGEFISCDGDGAERPSKVIETPLGKFRAPYDQRNLGHGSTHGSNYFSYVYRIKHPGRPHLAVTEYPDDTERMQEMRVTETPPWGKHIEWLAEAVMLANHSVILGVENPLTHKIREHRAIFWPNETKGTITFYSIGRMKGGWQPDMAARVGKIRIYEIEDIPMLKMNDAPGQPKWLGQQPEPGPRVVVQSCFTSPIAAFFRDWLIQSEAPNFYRNWMVTYVNLVKRLRFGGENAYFYGQYMYEQVLNKSAYSKNTEFGDYSGSLKDSGALMAKMFEENGLGMFTNLEIEAMDCLNLKYTDYDVAHGAPTLAQVTKDGKQSTALGRNKIHPNWLRPEVRKPFENIIDEYIAMYGKQKGWKGISTLVWGIYGPSWLQEGNDPYYASYDDYTIALFEKETGTKIPVANDDLKRFAKRYAWLTSAAKKEWTDWRAKKMTEIYEWMAGRLRATRPDLKLVVFPEASMYFFPSKETGLSPLEFSKQNGLDVAALKANPDVIFAPQFYATRVTDTWLYGKTSWQFRSWAHDAETLGALTNDGKNGLTIRFNWAEPDSFAPDHWEWLYCAAESWPHPPDEYFSDYWTNLFIRSNPTMIVNTLQDIAMWQGREASMAKFARAFRSLPVGVYRRLLGEGRDVNAWIETTATETGEVYGYVANPQYWPVEAEITFADDASAVDLLANKPIDGTVWKTRLGPYDIRTFRVRSAAADPVPRCVTRVDDQGKTVVRQMVEEAEKRLSENAETLRKIGRLEEVKGYVARAQAAERANDLSTAYETLDGQDYRSLWVRQVATSRPGDYVPRKQVVPKRVKPIAVDGDFSDWPNAPVERVNEKNRIFANTEDLNIRWEGEKDLAATFRSAWDENGVYLAVDITDDTLYFDPEVLHRGDSVELFFDAELGVDFGEAEYSDDDTLFKFAPSPNSNAALRIYRREGKEDKGKTTGMKTAWKQTDNGYRIEAFIPWELIARERPRQGAELGFDLCVNDAESKFLLKQFAFWSSNKTTCFKDPTSFGIIELGDENGRGKPLTRVKSPHKAYHQAKDLNDKKKALRPAP